MTTPRSTPRWVPASHRRALLLSALAGWLLLVHGVSAVDKSGVTPNTVSLPKGPGSIAGLGGAFEPLLNDGTGKYAIALTVPPGTAGHTPALALRYEGGSGNGPLGIGWRLDVPAIQRCTDKGIPRYVDAANGIDDDADGETDEADELDVFVDSEAEELVPVANADGVHTDYFRRHEGAFVRYRRQGDGWEGRLPDGTRLQFGTSPAGRLNDGTGTGVFRWLLERSTDTCGNTIVFLYTAVPDAQNTNQIYLAEIRYGAGAPDAGSPPRWPAFHFVRFTYAARPDWFEDCRAGFVVRTGLRLTRIAVGTQGGNFASLGHATGDTNGDGTSDVLDRAYRLAYDADPHWSLLSSLTPVGADDLSVLPPVTFTYTTVTCGPTLSAAGQVVGSTNEPAQVMDLPWADLLDVNGDGLPDILRTNPVGGPHTAYINQGEAAADGRRAIRWSAGVEVGGDAQAWTVDLAADHGAIAHLADMDADGLADLVLVTATDAYYFPNGRSTTAPAWQTRRRMRLAEEGNAPPPPFGAADVRTADLDFDKRIDIIQSVAVGDGARYRVWLNLDGERYSRAVTVTSEQGFRFSDTGVHIADVNGDGVPDIARVRASELWITAGVGYGQFVPLVPVHIPGWTLDAEQVQQAVLEDVTGDGLADLVVERAAPGELWLWVNQGNYTLAPRCVVTGLPTQFGTAQARRWADLNGNGTVDLVYADSAASPRLQAVDIGRLLGCVPTPHLLVGIDNGIGRRITIGYATTTAAALADAAAGAPWPDPLPFPVDVVTAVSVDDTRGNLTRTAIGYHEGYYDPTEHDFCGFARVVQTDHGDQTAPTLVSRFLFHTGKDNLAMKGNPLSTSVEEEHGGVFRTETTTWATRVLYPGLDGRTVRVALPTARRNDIIELGLGPPRRTESEFDYDDYGNQTAGREYGIVEGNDRGAGADERLTRTEYACNLSEWLLRFPSRTTVRDLAGTVVTRAETYYDDPTFRGANLGAVTAGLPTLLREWTDPAQDGAFVEAARTQYDAYGNPVALLDPLAVAPGGVIDDSVGHYRTVTYDAAFHTYAEAETVHLEAGKADLVIQATYDAGLGLVAASVEPNGHTTTYGYDAFGRLVRVLRPGDRPDYPSTEYSYVLGQALGGNGRTGLVVTPSGVSGEGLKPSLRTTETINWVETRLLDREPGSAATPRDHYLISRAFVDGLGRQLMAKAEAKNDPETGAPRVAVTGAVRFNTRGAPAAALNPFHTLLGGDLDAQLAFEDTAAPDWQGSFHLNGQQVSLGLAAAHTARTIYDAALRPVRTIGPDGSESRQAFEPLAVRSFDENDTDPTSQYSNTPVLHCSDGLGRLVRVNEVVRLNDDGSARAALQTWTTSYQYRADGPLARLVDSQNNTKAFAYDGLGRKTALHDPDRGTVIYLYDAAANLVQTTDAKGQTIAYAYDGANRLLTETYTAPGAKAPDEAFRPSPRDGKGQKPSLPAPDVTYHYDVPAGAIDLGNGQTGTATSTRGRLAWVEDLTGEEHTSYDERGREAWVVKSIPDPVTAVLAPYQTTLVYDAMDRLAELVYPDGDGCTYEYNRGGSLERIVGGESANLAGTPYLIAGVDQAPSGQPVSILYGNGVRTTQRYDARLRLARLRSLPSASASPAPGAALIDCAYSLDAASNILRISDQRGGTQRPAGDPRRNTQVFQYDDLYRLTRVQYSLALPGEADRDDGHLAYRYDRIGNLLEQTSNLVHADAHTGLPVCDLGAMVSGGAPGAWNRSGRAAADPPGPHALTAITHPTLDPRPFPYDANGNLTSIDGLACTWDVLDRLVAVENEQMRADYAYDYSGRRIWKRVWARDAAGQTETFPSSTTVYVGRHFEVREYDQPTKYVFAGDTRVASITGTLDPSRPRVQRFRVSPGWNLLTLAVTLPSSAPLFRVAAAAFLWDVAGGGYLPVGPTEPLPAGAVLWLHCDRADTLVVAGTYAEPGSFPIAAGGSFVSGPPLAAWSADSALPALTRAWHFDPVAQQWQVKVPADLAFLSDFPAFVSPGEPVFVAAAAASTLDPRPSLSILYYHQDHLGSSAVITDAEGSIVDETTYYPYGYPRHHDRPAAARAALPAHYGFAQKEQDDETGLHYVGARYMVAALGRFASVDPLVGVVTENGLASPQRVTAYAYALDNPVRFTDPTGLTPQIWFGENRIGVGALRRGDILLKRQPKGGGSWMNKRTVAKQKEFQEMNPEVTGGPDLVHAAIYVGNGTKNDMIEVGGKGVHASTLDDSAEVWEVFRYSDRTVAGTAADVATRALERAQAPKGLWGRLGYELWTKRFWVRNLTSYNVAGAAVAQQTHIEPAADEAAKAARGLFEGNKSFFCSEFVIAVYHVASAEHPLEADGPAIGARARTTPMQLHGALWGDPRWQH